MGGYMHIETYVVEETADLIYSDDKLSEWNKLTEELGLQCQKQLTQGNKSPIPFLPMNTRMENVLKELCPTTVEIKNYRLTPIPLEVLKLVSLATKERYFGSIWIMYDETSKDPACYGMTPGVFVDNPSGSRQAQYGAFHTREECQKFIEDNGLKDHKPYSYGGQKYLIARWADVKQTWDELSERATKLFCSRTMAKLQKEISERQTELENIKNDAVLRFC